MRHAFAAITLTAALTASTLAQAGSRIGDFGRPEPSVINRTILPWLGDKLAGARGEPVSRFHLTDREMELRARAWHMFMPGHRLHYFARSRAELVMARVWPDEKYIVDITHYFHALRAQGFISSAARYNALEQAIRADLGLIEPFMVEVERVYAADCRRLEDLARYGHAEPTLAQDAHARIHENRRVVDWAIIAMQWRVEAYRYALDVTRIELPSHRAGDVEVALTRMSAAVDIMTASVDRLESGCGPVHDGPNDGGTGDYIELNDPDPDAPVFKD